MKRVVSSLLLLAGVFLLAGCQKDKMFGPKDAIRFTAGTPGTKTVYSDYSQNGKTRIDWVEDEEIRIFSDLAVHRNIDDQKWADYIIQNVRENGIESLADIDNIPGDGSGNGLIWKEAGTYQFFGVSPKVSTFTFDDSNKKGRFQFTLPSSQDFSENGDLSQYGFMTAWASVTTDEYGVGDEVHLPFEPAFTTFQISIRSAGDAIGLKEFKLFSEGEHPVVGDFSVNYSSAGVKNYEYTANINDKIVVNLQGKDAPAASANKDLTFTVFALPKNFDDLCVSFTTSQDNTRTLKLQKMVGEEMKYISFAGGSKHKIYGLVLPNGELLISVDTAPWVDGLDGEDHTYTTIEDASTIFDSYQAYVVGGGEPWSAPTYVAIAPGYSSTTDPETGVTTESPEYSPMFTLTTVSVGVQLQLISDNPKVGFYTTSGGIQSSLTIPASTITTEKPYGTENVTSYFVVPLDSAADGDIANISLIRLDSNTPIAYTHQNLPGTTDHTKVMFMVVTPDKYQNNTTHMTPDDN